MANDSNMHLDGDISEQSDSALALETDAPAPAPASALAPAATSTTSIHDDETHNECTHNDTKDGVMRVCEMIHDSTSSQKSTATSNSILNPNQSTERAQLQARQLFQNYLRQLTVGCGRKCCSNQACASNPKVGKQNTHCAAMQALECIKTHANVCTTPFEIQDNKIKTEITAEKLREVMAEPELVELSFTDDLHDQSKKAQIPDIIDIPIPDTNQKQEQNQDEQQPSDQKSAASSSTSYKEDFLTHAINFDRVDAFYKSLNDTLNGVLFDTIAKNYRNFKPASIDQCRIYCILLENSLLSQPDAHEAMAAIYMSVRSLDKKQRDQLIQWYSEWPLERFEQLVDSGQQFITVQYFNDSQSKELFAGLSTIDIFYKANEARILRAGHSDKGLRFEKFYNDALNSEMTTKEMHLEFRNWKRGKDCYAATPWVLEPARKHKLLSYESLVIQQQARDHAYMSAILSALSGRPVPSAYLTLKVNRNNILEDTLRSLQSKPAEDLRLPLQVSFDGESGIDAGGLGREWMSLLLEQLFDPMRGVVIADEESRTYRFNPNSFESAFEYELIGMLFGIAVFNNILLDCRFDLAIYKKLLNIKPTWYDFEQAFPSLAKGLKMLLEFDGDVQTVYARSFTVDKEVYGMIQSVDLKPNGSNIPLTNENRKEYVDLVMNWHLNVSIEKQFSNFKEGFLLVVNGETLRLFRAEELELLINGSPELDMHEWEASAQYDEGWDAEHPVCKWFWEVVLEMPLEEHKKLLAFCTGSERVPIGGLGSFPLTLVKVNCPPDYLPASHTCFNRLDLSCNYVSKEQLRERLQTALRFGSVGFGII